MIKFFCADFIKSYKAGLETAIAGSAIYRYETEEQLEMYSQELKADIKRIRKNVKLVTEGVCVAASTLGSLEAFLVFLKSQKIPVAAVCIGDVSKEDTQRALTPMLTEENKKKKREFATILAFDVKILPDAAGWGLVFIFLLFGLFLKRRRKKKRQKKTKIL